MERFAEVPWALTTIGMAAAHLELKDTSDDREAMLAFLCAAATVDVEAECGRKLKSRTYSGVDVLRVRGDGSAEIAVPEFPVTAVTKIEWIEPSDGSKTALDLTGLHITGALQDVIRTPNDAVPYRTWAEVTGEAGYLEGQHVRELRALEQIALRVVTIKWQDHQRKVGRSLEVNIRGASVRLLPTRLPEDLRDALMPFKRIGGVAW